MTDTSNPRNIRPERPAGTTQLPAHYNVEAANTAVEVTLADPGDYFQNVIAGVAWSYSAAPTGGKLTIDEGTNTIFEVDITAAGPGLLNFGGFTPGASKELTVTLAAGGGGVIGKLTLIGAVIEEL